MNMLTSNIIQCCDNMLVMLVSVLIVIFPTSLTACHNHCLMFEVLFIYFYYYNLWFFAAVQSEHAQITMSWNLLTLCFASGFLG